MKRNEISLELYLLVFVVGLFIMGFFSYHIGFDVGVKEVSIACQERTNRFIEGYIDINASGSQNVILGSTGTATATMNCDGYCWNVNNQSTYYCQKQKACWEEKEELK